jgi:hypothetical protein
LVIGRGREVKYARRLAYAKQLDLTALDATHGQRLLPPLIQPFGATRPDFPARF